MTAEKPSKVAHAAAAVLLSGKKGGATLKEIAEAGAVIDREAVAPAVRELVEALEKAELRISWHEGSTPLQQELLALGNKYRHLIEGDET